MDCPICGGHRTLQIERPEDGPPIRRCPGCGGHWLRNADYWRWRARHGPDRTVSPEPEALKIELADPPGLKRCPEDEHILARFRVGPSSPFSIDQCRTCGGIWFDPGEWEALQGEGLHVHLHHVLSEEWEDRLREMERKRREDQQWARQLGEADLERIREIKAWLDAHPKRSELYAFLRFHERAV